MMIKERGQGQLSLFIYKNSSPGLLFQLLAHCHATVRELRRNFIGNLTVHKLKVKKLKKTV